ncbi:hypothetical protein J2W58_000029 [Pseudomonas psychrotolerans]|nr:hypothetical protein [Pseudomonas psychrotolerans]
MVLDPHSPDTNRLMIDETVRAQKIKAERSWFFLNSCEIR